MWGVGSRVMIMWVKGVGCCEQGYDKVGKRCGVLGTGL